MIRYKKIEHNIYPLLELLKKSLSLDKEVMFAYVFGSYGLEKTGPLSDVDIALYLVSTERIWKKKMELIGDITSILKTDEVDLIIFNEASLSLCYQVLKTGKLLFSKNELLRISFISNVHDMYCDTESLRQSAQENLLARIREGRIGLR